MLNFLVETSLRYRRFVVVLACLFAVYGVETARHAKLDVFPDFVPPQVTVQTEAPGLAPEEVERLVTRVIETALGGLGRQESLRSESIQGLSIVTIVFEEGTDVFLARQMLGEKLSELNGQLPAGVKSPKMSPLTSSTMDLLKIGMVSDRMTAMELRTFADWTLKPRLLALPGVAKCSVFGGEVRQSQVRVSQDKLRFYGLSMLDVLAAARGATGVRGGGFVEGVNQRILVQSEGQALTASMLGDVYLSTTTNASVVRIRDVAKVVDGPEPKFGDCLIQGRAGVLMTMSSQWGANTLEVTRELERALEEMKPTLKELGIQLFPRLHRPATFIETALSNMGRSLLLGALLVVIVLFVFLGHFRTAMISLTAIPLSLLTAVVLMEKWGISLNTVTLGGLAIAIGEVVDDAIIDVENIFRRLVENRDLVEPRPVLQVVLDASLEVRSAVVFATFIVAMVFVPVLTLSGLQGSFFAPLATSYLLAIGASLVVALVLTPALCLIFLGGVSKEHAEPRLQRSLKGTYSRVLAVVMAWPRLVVSLVVILCVLTFARMPSVGDEFLPEFREGHFVLQVSTIPGTSLPEMLRLGTEISKALLEHPAIQTVEQQIGRAEQGEDPWGPHRSEFHVELKGDGTHDEEEVSNEIRKILAGFPGIQSEVLTFLGDRIGETITGETAPVVVQVYGEELDELEKSAGQVARVLKHVPGAVDVQVKTLSEAPRLSVKLRMDRLASLGFRPVDLLEVIQTAHQGTVAAQMYQGAQSIDVVVMLEELGSGRDERIGELMLKSPTGMMVPLREVADIYYSSGRQSILHDAGRRRQTITCGVEGRDLGSFTDEVRRELAGKLHLPAGFYWSVGGQAEAGRAARSQLLMHSLFAGGGILLLLALVLKRTSHVLLVLANVPFSWVGAAGAILLTGWITHADHVALNLGALIGLVTLFGITMRNSIMLVSHYEHLVMKEGCVWNKQTAIRGAAERFLPIVMTALVTGLGLMPLALGSGEAGRELEGPMAIVILGGLLTSTLLNLLVLPSLALKFGRFGHASFNA